MIVKNYYKMDKIELSRAIHKIRHWLFDFPTHKQEKKAEFALDVALCAKELKRDEFINLCIEHLT